MIIHNTGPGTIFLKSRKTGVTQSIKGGTWQVIIWDDTLEVVEDPMAKIPLAATMLASGQPRELQQLLCAIILRMQQDGEEEGLIVHEADLVRAQGYTLITSVISEENVTVLSVRPK